MCTELQLDANGLDQFGRSALTIPELLGHMSTARKIATLDSAFQEIGAAPARLTIRLDGTHIVLPKRKSSLEQTLPATATLIEAMARFAANPSEESAATLKRAENQFDPVSLRCVKHAIYDACRSEEMQIQANLGEKTIHFRLPHKAMLPAHKNPTPRVTNGDDDKIKKILRYLDAVSSSGMAALIRWKKSMPNIKAGDRIMLKMSKNPKRFLRLNDTPTGRKD